MDKKRAVRQEKSLLRTWNWFRNSGVMLPADGTWGVAERIILTSGNSALEKTLDSFPAWTLSKNHCIIEQRRADCNMQTAYLFLKLHEQFGSTLYPFRETAGNILDFLYFKSGLLHRNGPGNFPGCWEWSHIKFSNTIYFDDNAWMVTLPLKIARKFPALDKKYEMSRYALLLADTLAEEAPLYLNDTPPEKSAFPFRGNIHLPHWGSLVCMALAEAYRKEPKEEYLSFIDLYEDFLLEKNSNFTGSEFAYAILGATSSFYVAKREKSRKVAEFFARNLLDRMDPHSGCIPSEHYEAPSGKALADTIYTINWAVLALQNMARLDDCCQEPFQKLLTLLLNIQDTSRAKYLQGCWRGMFDLENNQWGGGDRYEGGANSIYTGWTNAPIAWAMVFDLLRSSLMED